MMADWPERLRCCENVALALAEEFLNAPNASDIKSSQLKHLITISVGYDRSQVINLARHQHEKAKKAAQQSRKSRGTSEAQAGLWKLVERTAKGEGDALRPLLGESGELGDRELHWILGLFATEIAYQRPDEEHRRGR